MTRTSKDQINLIYLKRDLRLYDNPVFSLAEDSKIKYSVIFIFEPEYMQQSWFDIRHYKFIYSSLVKLNESLSKFGYRVCLLFGDPVEVFSYIMGKVDLKTVFSHQEVGPKYTFLRDKRLRNFFKLNNIEWIEIPTDGIIRGKSRPQGWRIKFEEWLETPVTETILSRELFYPLDIDQFLLPQNLKNELSCYPTTFQEPGERAALATLKSFLDERGRGYLANISKPFESHKYSSRLSCYLAYGNVSARVVFQLTKKMITENSLSDNNRKSYEAFLSRIFWRSHFMQKLENMPQYEYQSINPSFEPWPFEHKPQLVEAWIEGETGFDLVDAVMKCLKTTGWINFRMRAMLVSFLCHVLQQPWQAGANLLARYFLDFEGGIHFPQFQMQAGVTGFNTIRVYDPDKQLRDNDPRRLFCKIWLKGKTRQKPLVDLKSCLEISRRVLWGIKMSHECRENATKLLMRLNEPARTRV
ncbi:MAG: deoxyribodipyrimidine photo-lyase [Deltaproteobacteria bacterium]|nr:deoxyribodipyrimidine photo-lyase [Deltaproteobacteria bacterium]